MNAIRLLFLACGAAALGTPALADGSDNTVSLTQAASVPQAGGNVSIIIQQGSNDYAESDQTGALNRDLIEQLGSNNSSIVKQQGIEGVVVDIQIGNGNSFTVTQTGINPPPIILVQHR